ncbi:Hypothetical protein CINCED_3A012206 [Cinara cedri]|uniref:Uncharacterized protein n=1 Tax=Cinara cedri TaxID=506608 RepID=A0A5E4M460_9HEMI|nr:Hypothetical protein CINCED_3A012206 [Cinara cedri]
MSFQSINFLLQQAEESQNKNKPINSNKIDLRTPYGLNDLMFDDNELYSCDQNIDSSMPLLRIENQTTDECSNISDYISKHLALLSTQEPKLSANECVKNIVPKLPLSENINTNCVNTTTTKPSVQKGDSSKKKYNIFRTKPLAKVRKSPLVKPDSGLSLALGRKYPKSNSNLTSAYLYNVLVETRTRGFRFHTPSPDESVLSWMDIVRQMPNK